MSVTASHVITDKDADALLDQWAESMSVWSDYPTQLMRCYADWLRKASAVQWHQAADAWNWDYGFPPMQWIASQRDCDRATAVLLYYLSGPSYFLQHETEPHERTREGYGLVATIRDRVRRGDYHRSEIAYDPRHEFATEMRLAPISNDAGFPVVLTGQVVPRPNDWGDGFPDEVWSAARRG